MNDISEGGHVNCHETIDNPSRTADKHVTLQALRIRLEHYCLEDSDQYSDCEMVQRLFQLVWYSRNIRPRTFCRELQGEPNQGDNENKAERCYDLSLKERAAKLAMYCKEPERCDGSEPDWEHLLSRRVFRSFIRSEENEGYTEGPVPTHHCLACRRDFPSGSRPQVHPIRDTRKCRGETIRSHKRFCESTDQHFNLPNCDHRLRLTYCNDDIKEIGKKGLQTPDTTFGLCTYNLDERHWTEKWLQNDMVKLFERKTLENTMNHFSKLKEPYKISSTQVGIYSYPMFAFGLWEAKQAKGYSHEDTLIQSSRKLKSLLKWQRNIFDESEVRETSPTVWYFSSLGSDWRVYGCSEKKSVRGDGFDYPMVHLWSGVSKDTESALQLLSIVDLIRFWVDYTYKPLIGACISRLEAIKANKAPTPINCTLWRLRIAIDKEQTPWFFSQRRLQVSSSPIGSTNNLGVPPFGRRRSHSPSSRQSLRPEDQRSPGRDHWSPIPVGKRFVTPEKDKFNWLLDRDPGEEDLILIRISEAREVMKPVIIYSTSQLVDGRQTPTVDWKDKKFKAVIEDETRGRHPQVVSMFREDRQGRNYLWKCYRHKNPLIHQGVQFSIILPANVVPHDQQNPESQGAQLFEPLESLFGLQDLLGKIKRANRKWCSCGRLRYNEYSSPVVQCRNALCNISWFHKECVGFPDSDEEGSDDEGRDDEVSDDEGSDDEGSDDEGSDVEAPWLCDKCKKTPEDERAYMESRLTESNVFAKASRGRLHLARAIENVWRKHDWPSQDEIAAKINEVADKVDIVENATYTIREAGGRSGLDLPRYWATSKDDPKKLILACSRRESLFYHQAVSNEEDDNEDSNNVEGFEEETDYYTAEDEEDALTRPKTTEIRGRYKSVDADQSIYVERDIATGSEGDPLVLPTPKMKHVQENRRPAKPRPLSR